MGNFLIEMQVKNVIVLFSVICNGEVEHFFH